MFHPGPGGAATCVLPLAVGRASAVSVCPVDAAEADVLVSEAWHSYHAELLAFLVRATRDHGVAEEISQEAFLRLCRELRVTGPPDNTRAWLYRVATNLAASRGRHLAVARRWQAAARPNDDAFEAPERTALRLERYQTLHAALEGLSPEQRLGLWMAAEGFSGREVASALGRSDVATRTMLCRARSRLRSELDMEGDR